ncbi:MAG: alanine--glyoxylate aminotransferase family protein [Bacteroidia bacterium]|nr:alanine--glyoxylate aminotransferase family protein [Bacteroidia bacterium]
MVTGSGTLANDVIAGQLSLLPGKGLILSNGEFGDRLIDHAKRIKLNFIKYQLTWGKPFDLDRIRKILRWRKRIRWIWMVHCETSTGMLNNLEGITQICKENNLLLSIDGISTIGNIHVNLSDIYLASCVSGKGLESIAGLALIFYNHDVIQSNKQLPRYFDLNYYIHTEGVPFTISSNLVMALNTSLKNLDIINRLSQIQDNSKWVRSRLEKIGYKILVDEKYCLPSVFTLVIPRHIQSTAIGDYVKANGFLLSYQSSYLIERNWVQICMMGNLTRTMLENLLNVMEKALKEAGN